MFSSRCARGALVALGVSFFLLGGCQHASTSDESANAASDEAQAGEESIATADRASQDAQQPLEPRGAYFPTIVLKTSLGQLTIKLDPQAAPRTVNNFLHYVENGLYDQTIFHQVEAGYVALGGAYTSDLAERPSRYPIPNEAANGRNNLRGTIAMARQIDNIDSSTSQFFINLQDNPHLDHHGESAEEYGFCVFGEVIEGMEVLDKISAVEVTEKDDFKNLPVQTVLIETAYRVR